MVEKALGLIEVRGFLGAIVVADAALKAANVSLLNVETVKSGLNTVQLVRLILCNLNCSFYS